MTSNPFDVKTMPVTIIWVEESKAEGKPVNQLLNLKIYVIMLLLYIGVYFVPTFF